METRKQSDVTTMFLSQFPLVDFTEVNLTDCFSSFIDHHDGTTCTFLSSISLRYTNIDSTYLEVEKQEYSFWFKCIPRSRDMPPTTTCSNLRGAWDLSPFVPFVFVALPLEEKSYGMGYFGLRGCFPSLW